MTVLSDADFYAPLKTSLILDKGSGNPTFTRSTSKTVFNNDGKLITVKSDAAAFGGARCIQNLQSYSEELSNAAWVKTRLSVSPDTSVSPDGNSTADKLVEDSSAASTHYIQGTAAGFSATNSITTYSIYIKSAERTAGRLCDLAGNFCSLFDLSAVTVTPSIGTATITSEGNGWYRVSVTSATAITSPFTPIVNICNSPGNLSYTGDGSSGFYVWGAMLEPVLSASAYLPTNVLPNPWHGGGVDGIKYFNTDSGAVPIPDATLLGVQLNAASRTNNLLWCRDLTNNAWIPSTTGSELVTDSGFDTGTGWTLSAGATISGSNLTLTTTDSNDATASSPITCVIGETYVVAIDCSVFAAGSALARVGTSPGSSSQLSVSINSTGTSYYKFTAVATTQYLTLFNFNNTGSTIVFASASIKNAEVSSVKNQTGIDAVTNSCTLITSIASNATILQIITAASTPACSSFYVKRSAGSGSIYFTRDGGSNWADITSLINSSAFTRVKIENTSVTNPQIGFKIATSGDAIIVDYGQNEAGTEVSMPILTTTANVTRNADVLTYPTSGNFSDTAGTILATVRRENWTNNNGSVVGSSTRGLYTSASNSGAQALDGTNTVNGPAGSIITQRKIGMKWSGSSLKVFAGGIFGSAGSYDGSFNLSTIAIMPGTNGYVRDVAIWKSSLSDADMLSAASFQTDTGAAGVGIATIANNYINSISAVALGAGGGSFANNYIHSVDASASGVGLSTITNNYIHSISAFADGVGGLSAEAISIKNIISSQSIQISYYEPRIIISI